MLSVKNVPTLPDGNYSIVGPPSWPQQPVVEGDDGILSLSPPIDLRLVEHQGNARQVDAAGPDKPDVIDFRGMDLSDARQPFSPGGEVVMATVVCIDRLPGRNFRIHVLRGDSALKRWVRIGTIDVGPGSQSGARRPLYWAALPVTVAVDIVTLPVLLVGALFMGGLEGISALGGG
jgi:hypothetical protein